MTTLDVQPSIYHTAADPPHPSTHTDRLPAIHKTLDA